MVCICIAYYMYIQLALPLLFPLVFPAVVIKPTTRDNWRWLFSNTNHSPSANAFLSFLVFLVLSNECAGVVLYVLYYLCERRIKHIRECIHDSLSCGMCIRYQSVETVLLISKLVWTGRITLSHRQGMFSPVSYKYPRRKTLTYRANALDVLKDN